MGQYFGEVSTLDILYAAIAAFFLTNLILRFKRIRAMVVTQEKAVTNTKYVDIPAVINRCRDMFPIETVDFRGQIFKTGMLVRIITIQKKVIEGELIGKNNLEIVCVLTKQHIIAHEIDKIEEMTAVEKE